MSINTLRENEVADHNKLISDAKVTMTDYQYLSQERTVNVLELR